MTALLIFLIILGIYCTCDAAKRGKAELKRISENNTNIPLQTRLYKKYFRLLVDEINTMNPQKGEYHKCINQLRKKYNAPLKPYGTPEKQARIIKEYDECYERYEVNRLWIPNEDYLEWALKESQDTDSEFNIAKRKYPHWIVYIKAEYRWRHEWLEIENPNLRDYEKMYPIDGYNIFGKPKADYLESSYSRKMKDSGGAKWTIRDHWLNESQVITAGCKADGIPFDSPAFIILINMRLWDDLCTLITEICDREMKQQGYVYATDWKESPNKKI